MVDRSRASHRVQRDPAFVHFIEARGRGIFLRAAPIDVAAIVRDAVLGGRAGDAAHVGHARRGRVVRLRPRPPRRAGCRDAAGAVGVRLPHEGARVPAAGHARSAHAGFQPRRRRRRRRDPRPHAGARVRAVHVLQRDARRPRAPRGPAAVAAARAGHGAADGAPPRLPRHAECRAVRHGELLAGRRRRRRGAELRDRRSAAVRVAGRSARRRADAGDRRRAAVTRSTTTRSRSRR